MSNTNDTSREELSEAQLMAVTGVSGRHIDNVIIEDVGGGGGPAGPAISAWNQLLKNYGYA